MIVVLRWTQDTAFINRLKSLGLIVRDAVDTEGRKRSAEQWIEDCTTPVLVDTQGRKHVSVQMSAKQAYKMPPDNNPAFSIIWREDELVEVQGEDGPYMTQKPWPMVDVSVESQDVDGNVLGTSVVTQPVIRVV
jgi:hypothetical protein